MKKATKKAPASKASPAATPVSTPTPSRLGNKRQCGKCGTKFYDFEKEEVNCPKCNAKVNLAAPAPILKSPAPEPKKKASDTEAAAEALSSDEMAMDSGDVMESVEDLGDDDAVEEIDVDDDGDEY